MHENRFSFTVSALDRIKRDPTKQKTIFRDSQTIGLYLMIRPSDRVFFYYQRRIGSRILQKQLGEYPRGGTQVQKARAIQIVREKATGINLSLMDGSFKEEGTGDTLNDLVPRFYSFLRGKGRSERTISDYQNEFDNRILPVFGTRTPGGIKRHEVKGLFDSVTEQVGPVRANHMIGAISSFFGWLVEAGTLETNPIQGFKKNRATIRERELSFTEIKTLWGHLTEGNQYENIVKLILTTGSRPGEVMNAEWAEFDLETRIWTIPPERMKNDQPHQVPLSDLALDILSRIPQEGQYVFPGNGGKGTLGKSALTNWLTKKGHFGLPAFHGHDLRRTVGSRLAELGVSEEMIERVLSHTKSRLVRTYQRYNHINEKREALQRLADKIREITA